MYTPQLDETALTARCSPPMLWLSPLPYAALDRRIREVFAERMERGATDERDRRLAALIAERDHIERAGWFLMTHTRRHHPRQSVPI